MDKVQIGTVYIDDANDSEPISVFLDGYGVDEDPVLYFEVPLSILGEVVQHTVCVYFDSKGLGSLEALVAKTRERCEKRIEDAHS